MRKEYSYEQQNDPHQNQNPHMPVTMKNNTRRKNIPYNNLTSEYSLDSPINKFQLSRKSPNYSNPQNTTYNKLKIHNQIPSKDNLKLKDNNKSPKHKKISSYEDQNQENLKRKNDQDKISKIQLGEEKVIQLPVKMANSNDQFLSEQSQTNQIDSEKSEPQDLPSKKSQFPNPDLKKKQKINGFPYQQTKRCYSQIPSSFRFPSNRQSKPDKDQVKHSQSITDSIVSPYFNHYLSQSHSHLIPGFSKPLYPHKGYHHNQCPPTIHSETLPKLQNTHYRTTFIKQELKLTLANNLEKILFKYNGGHARILYNNMLKIKNDSSVKVEVKIMCTSPSHYEVRPYSNVILCPSQVLNVLIQMKLYVQDINQLTMKHELSRYKQDKFKISYWSSEYWPNIWYQSGQKVLPVSIEDTEDEKIRSKGMIENRTNEEIKMIQGQKNIEMYKKMINQTRKKINMIEFEIKKVQKNKFHHKYLTKTLIWLAIIVGLAIGYWLG